MRKPDSMPENIWQTILLLSEILQNKRDNALASSRLARLSYTATKTVSQGDRHDRYQHRNETAGCS